MDNQEEANREDQVERIPHMDMMPPAKASGISAYMPTVIISALVCGVILFTGIIPQNYVTKTDFTANLQSMVADAGAVKSSVSDLTTKVAQATNDIAAINKASKDYATAANLATMKSTVDTINANIGNVTSLGTQINSLSSKVDALTKQATDSQALIKALQDEIASLRGGIGVGGGTTTNSVVKSTFSTSNWVPTSYTPSATTPTFQLPFKINITNGLNRNITNLQLFLSMYSTYTGAGATGTLQALSGGAWTSYTAQVNTFYFTNSTGMTTWGGTGLSIPANTTTTITLIFTYTAPATAYGTLISFSPDMAPITPNDYTVS